ncbi:tetratricopeptide repeat-containing sulfotransferase family protein [Sphingomicrobium flavum]|uniref:tetratricopeptide repeat-containing sulfotransferase family protein n=1 Tax=Sphingomicrobium flavum TaxID=1229164 RepID=UPI0021AD5584|nr:tetratricopeptide repeat-containing sulfotransferase family protein [Sphingomicrobium flavum]
MGDHHTDQPLADPLAAAAHGRRLLADRPDLAALQAQEILSANPHFPPALRLLGAARRALGDDEAASEAELAAIDASTGDAELIQAGAALVANELPVAERILKARLKADPFDVAAIRMLAELAARIGRLQDAENLLRRAMELAPDFGGARANLATILYRQNRNVEALDLLEGLSDESGFGLSQRNLRAATLSRLGGYDEAIALYRDVLEKAPKQAKVWMSLGHLLKTVGNQEEAVAAYRQSVALQPDFGEAWWSLANLKTVRFVDADVAAMQSALGGDDLAPDDQLHLEFALGKAAEDRRDHDAAWAHYAKANRIRAAQLRHDPDQISKAVDRAIALFTPEFFAKRQGWGCPADDPIFILGMPRAGSTLIEQILASHPQVEGTMELPDIITMSRELAGKDDQGMGADLYPEILADLDADQIAALGRDFLDRTRIHRKEGRPFFIDKMPNNWMHAGFIRLILPKARIIDARRHPLACGYSNFKQHFARGQSFAYRLDHFGRYYADYCRLMAHLDTVQPGAVTRIIHEDLVDDPDSRIRALLDRMGLPFDQRCIDFHQTERAVRTASSEQVRRPITKAGLDSWKAHEPHLDPLKHALGHWLQDWTAPSPA